MPLFGKRYCVNCGRDLGMLEGKRLADGEICKECLSLASYWLTDRKKMTAADMAAHLTYREENYTWLQNFHATASAPCNSGTALVWDEGNRWFVIQRTRDILQENPDVLTPEHVLSVTLFLDESRSTLRHNEPDRPPFDEEHYSYHFRYELAVNHQWFSVMRFHVNGAYTYANETARLQQYYREALAVKELFEAMGISVAVSDGSSFGLQNVVSGNLPAHVLDPMLLGGAVGAAAPPPPAPGPRPGPGPHPAPGPRPAPAPRPEPRPRPAPHPRAEPAPGPRGNQGDPRSGGPGGGQSPRGNQGGPRSGGPGGGQSPRGNQGGPRSGGPGGGQSPRGNQGGPRSGGPGGGQSSRSNQGPSHNSGRGGNQSSPQGGPGGRR